MVGHDHDRAIAAAASRILAAQSALIEHLPAGYVYDSAVVVLLTLFNARVAGETLSHKQLCDAVTYAPFSVSTRWVKALESDGLVLSRDADKPDDPEVVLTDLGLNTVRSAVMAVDRAARSTRDRSAIEPFSASPRKARSTASNFG
jgi:hypothetical protein